MYSSSADNAPSRILGDITPHTLDNGIYKDVMIAISTREEEVEIDHSVV